MTQEEFNILVEQSQPHEVFSKDFSNYYSYQFADTFLPKVIGYDGKATRVYDGANLFKGLRLAKKDLLSLTNNEKLISIIAYTYPKGVKASEKIKTVKPAPHEVCCFVEVDKNDEIEVNFTYGKKFTDFISEHSPSTNSYKTTVSDFKKFFKNTITHNNLTRFVLNGMGIEEKAVEKANYNQFFSEKLINYLDEYKIAKKYDIHLFIAKNQTQAGQESGDLDSNPSVKPFIPEPNDIFVWLVSEDYRNFDTSFIVVKVGSNVREDIKEKEITVNDLAELILDQIKAQTDQKIFSENKVEVAAKKGIATSFLRLGYQNRIDNDPIAKEIAKNNPFALITIDVLDYAMSKIETLKLSENVWNPMVKPYSPLLPDPVENAFFCGIYNGSIQAVKDIPEIVKLFTLLKHSPTEAQKFYDGIIALFTEEGIFEAIINKSIEGYKRSIYLKNTEKFIYHLGYDTLQIVSLFAGVVQFAKGVSNFLKFTKNALRYLKKNGKKGIDELKNLDQKQLKEVFEDIDNYDIDDLYRNKGTNKNDGGVKLTRNQLSKLKKDLELRFKEFGLKVEIVTNKPKFKERLKRWNSRKNTQGSFNPGPPPTIYVRQNCTKLTLQHEVWHMEDLKKLGQVEYKKIINWKHEESIWNKIWKTKNKWTNEELVDSYWYYKKEVFKGGGTPNEIDEMEELLKLFSNRLRN